MYHRVQAIGPSFGRVQWESKLLGSHLGTIGKHMSHPDPKMTSQKTSGPEMGTKFVIPTTTTRGNTCPTQIPRWHPQNIRTWDGYKVCFSNNNNKKHMSHPDPKMTSPKHQDLRWVQSLFFQQQQQETHVPPRSQDDIPKNIRTWDGCSGISREREVCGEQEFLPSYFPAPNFLPSSTSDHTHLTTTYLFVFMLFVCCFDLILILHL
jgi:hypothetical protein